MDIPVPQTHHMKILLDEMCDMGYDMLEIKGYDVHSVVRLRKSMKDIDVITYARDNHMIVVTKDNKCGRKCEQAGVQHILLEDNILYNFLASRLEEMKAD